MKTRAILSLSLSALVLGGSTVGCAMDGGGVGSASSNGSAVAAKGAAEQAVRAAKALARNKPAQAVRAAEAAVALRPTLADYRVLLGQSYLKAGRFASARQAFADALTLEPENGKAALNLALVETGLGDWAGARGTLDAHAQIIPAADRGLAMALAGDPTGAVEVLTAAARTPEADVKTRQNLALALALAGRWREARAVAAADLSPADVDARIEQWAAFARPSGAADQVAALLGVTPTADAGQPVALALAAPAPAVTPVKPTAVAAIAAAPAPVAPAPVAPKPVPVAVAAVPMVQPLPAPLAASAAPAPAAPAPAARVAAVKPHRPAAPVQAEPRGDWYVQLGAFENAAVARDGWARAMRRDAVFRGRTPQGMTFRAKVGDVYRLSVGGFSRAQADATCRAYRAKGGACFVRSGAGDQVAAWVKDKRVQLASR